MAYKHGVYVAEQGTSIVAPVTATAGLQVVIGTAPINRASDPYHCTNTPMLANTLAGATAAVGYDDDYEKYTVCQSMGASFKVVGVSPMILINVLDPNKHKKNLPEKTVQVNDGVAVVEEKDILLDKLTVKAEETPLAAGTDYTAAFDDNGYVNIVVIPGGAGDSATSLTVSGVQIDPTAVTPADIVGAVTADGVESGMEVIRQIFPKLNMTPGILLAPGWSENALVSAGLQAKTSHINGVFNCVCIVDIDSSTAGATKYDDVKRQKEKQAVTSANCYAVWLYAKVGDVIYAGSAIGTAPEITLPQITSETIDVSGAGILGKISAPNIGQFESIEQEVSFNLVYSSFVNVLSPKRQVNLTFRVAQQAVDKSLGYAYKGLRIVEVGRVKEFTPGKIKAGEGMEAKVKLELTYIMIENDGEEIIAIDKLNGVYRVQGEDMLADVTALI